MNKLIIIIFNFLQGTLIILVTHIICYYFWKTRYYWLAKLHQKKDNMAVKKLLSLGKLATAGMLYFFQPQSKTIYMYMFIYLYLHIEVFQIVKPSFSMLQAHKSVAAFSSIPLRLQQTLALSSHKQKISFYDVISTYFTASQASLKNQLLEAIYNDDVLMLSDALTKAETGKGGESKPDYVNKIVLSMAKVRVDQLFKPHLKVSYRKVPAICACAYRQDHLSPCQNLSSTLHAHRTICTLGIYVGPVSIYLEPNIHLQSAKLLLHQGVELFFACSNQGK